MAEDDLFAESHRLLGISRLLGEKSAILGKIKRTNADRERLKAIDAEMNALGPIESPESTAVSGDEPEI